MILNSDSDQCIWSINHCALAQKTTQMFYFYREDESSSSSVTEASNREGNFIFDTLQFHQKSEEEEENSNGDQQVISRLSVEDVERVKDSGNYTCAPSNARSTSIMVHVVDGKIHINTKQQRIATWDLGS